MGKSCDKLMQEIGYHFSSEALLAQALTHPSCGQKNNQRLEFLGDAVLECIISEKLYNAFPTTQEGRLTGLRQDIVCEHALALVARKINLGDYLIMEKGLVASGGRNQDSILADAVEALIASIYLDGGFEETVKFIDSFFTLSKKKELDGKSALQEYLQGRSMQLPVYETLRSAGTDHAPLFTSVVWVEGEKVASGTQASKQKAEQLAAKNALAILKQRK